MVMCDLVKINLMLGITQRLLARFSKDKSWESGAENSLARTENTKP